MNTTLDSPICVKNSVLDNIVADESSKIDIPKKVLDYLENHGYSLIERLDINSETSKSEGHTSTVYLANFKSGDISKKRVVKIPLSWIDSSSITTLINLSKKNIYSNEVKYAQHFSNDLAHESIIDVVDHFKIEGYDVIVENYNNRSRSLKSSLRWSTPNDKKLSSIYNKILNGFEHMHKNGVIYRDCKSSNILVRDDDDLVKIIDLQNCARENEPISSSIQSKGGTAYSKREVINAVMKGESIRPSRNMDMHSLNVLLYEMVTGELPFDYKLEKAEEGEGKELAINGKTYYVKLLRNGQSIDEITESMYKSDVKKALKSLKGKQKRFIGLLEKGFMGKKPSIVSEKKNRQFYDSVSELREDFNKMMRSPFNKLTDIIYSSLKPAIITSAVLATLGGLVILGKSVDKSTPRKPTMVEIMQNVDYRNFSLETLKEPECSYMWSMLQPRIKNLKKKINTLENSKDHYYTHDIGMFSQMSQDIHQISKRLYSSLCRSIVAVDTTSMNKSYVKDRYWPTLVPKDFIIHNDYGTNYSHGRDVDINQRMAYAAIYLKMNMGAGKDIADVFASYICSNEELATAKINSKSWKYFPYISSGSEIMRGYGQYISEDKREIIDKAVLLYEITNEEGNVDWSKLPKLIPQANMTSENYNSYRIFPSVKDTIHND